MAKTKAIGESENEDKTTVVGATASSSNLGTSISQDNDNISTRVGSRTKKAKVVFDPSDHYIPRKRLRKPETSSLENPVVMMPGKPETIGLQSPVKPARNTDNGASDVAKPRLSLSPLVSTKTSNYKPKVFGSMSPESGRLVGSSCGNVSLITTQKQEFKREPICDMCHKIGQLRRGFKLIDCSSCAFRAHSKCLRAHPVYSKFPIQLNFRCFQCIECVVCGKSLRGGNLLFCCDCQNAFHQNCHGPTKLDKSPNGPWICKRCTCENVDEQLSTRSQEKQPAVILRQEPLEIVDDEAHQEFAGFSDNEIRKDSFSLSDGTINESSSQMKKEEDEILQSNSEDDSHVNTNNYESEKEKLDARLDNFENLQNWSCEDVFRYFKHYFPEHAHLFKEQEIDGPSLVLMRKSDVLNGFGIKLGPAINLYQRIVMMQNNDRDFRLTWI
ncbi:zinc finger protein dpff-1 [Malaya genurostris]|uniref:zinc finger protein dpff-1 n=1 Tax=Malaya genurostris TaxID=325434 RepID=UPI0026F3EA28|nr:zinc finger protein dpff-1 [Malaya genurostris]